MTTDHGTRQTSEIPDACRAETPAEMRRLDEAALSAVREPLGGPVDHTAVNQPNQERNQMSTEQEEFADLIPAAPATATTTETSQEQPPTPEIISPIDGRCADPADADELIDLLESLNEIDSKVYATKIAIREALAKLTEGDAKTRRVQGQRRKAVVEMPGEKFEQSILKSLWESHPKFAHQYLRIGTIDVQVREYRKIINTSSTEADFTYFRDTLTGANRGQVGTPTVKIEI
jgi:hypothetical protein